MDSEGDLVTIVRGYGASETQVIVAYLSAYGISAVPFHAHTAAVAWHLMHAIGGVEIKVPAAQVEEAMALLAEMGTGSGETEAPALIDWWRGLWATLVFLLFGVPPPARGSIRNDDQRSSR
ncbi:hypothetical protein [Pelagibacterium halotolerans]|uniref:hypothetical protein n=1 Tax=Pelagibacterium halotolerans TaxID=531813 RepID=UPI003850D8EE